jgi:hypothetical protein
MRAQRFAFVFAFSLLVLVGCKDETADRIAITGTVTLKGAPLDTGSIQFMPEGAGNQAGATIANGKYEIAKAYGLTPGKYKVIISSGSPQTIDENQPPGQARPVAKDRVPAEWNSKSNQFIEVSKGGKTEFSFSIP